MGHAVAEGWKKEVTMQEHGLKKIVSVGPGIAVVGSAPMEEDSLSWQAAWDDVSGQEPDPAEVAKACGKEMDCE